MSPFFFFVLAETKQRVTEEINANHPILISDELPTDPTATDESSTDWPTKIGLFVLKMRLTLKNLWL